MLRKSSLAEYRKHHRQATDLPVVIHRAALSTLGVKGGRHEAACRDLSKGGVRLVTEEPFYRWERLKLTFCGRDGRPEASCEAQVVRASRVVNGRYEVACRILRALPLDRNVRL